MSKHNSNNDDDTFIGFTLSVCSSLGLVVCKVASNLPIIKLLNSTIIIIFVFYRRHVKRFLHHNFIYLQNREIPYLISS